MKRAWWAVCLAAGSAWPAPAQSASAVLSPDKVREAIEWGRGASDGDLKQYELKTAENWLANFDTPFLRVAQLSAAMERSGKTLAEADVPPRFVANELHVYLHARQESAGPAPLPNFEYVMVSRPAAGGRTEVVLPTAIDRFVRQVPIPGYYGPARVAQSVRASFPLGTLVPGCELRVVLQGGSIEAIPIESAAVARAK